MNDKHLCPCCRCEVTDPERWESETYDGLCESCEIEWCESAEYAEALEKEYAI